MMHLEPIGGRTVAARAVPLAAALLVAWLS